jgi:uncharacterized membrane-anchored protein
MPDWLDAYLAFLKVVAFCVGTSGLVIALASHYGMVVLPIAFLVGIFVVAPIAFYRML